MKGVHQMVCEGNFQREIKFLYKCSHPNIIRLIALVVDAEDRVKAMLMEYVENAKSLSSLGSISRDELGKWTHQMREAISCLHEKNLVWGDSKASNILIREDGSIVLIDFGGSNSRFLVRCLGIFTRSLRTTRVALYHIHSSILQLIFNQISSKKNSSDYCSVQKRTMTNFETIKFYLMYCNVRVMLGLMSK